MRDGVISEMGDPASCAFVIGPRMMTPDFNEVLYHYLRGITLNTYDEYLPSGVALPGNFKSQWDNLRLNLSS